MNTTLPALAAIIAASLLTGCGSREPSETAILRSEVNNLTRTVADLQTRVKGICIDVEHTPSGDVVVPCARGSSVTPPAINAGFYNPAYRSTRY